jgi:hypothetical protein
MEDVKYDALLLNDPLLNKIASLLVWDEKMVVLKEHNQYETWVERGQPNVDARIHAQQNVENEFRRLWKGRSENDNEDTFSEYDGRAAEQKSELVSNMLCFLLAERPLFDSTARDIATLFLGKVAGNIPLRDVVPENSTVVTESFPWGPDTLKGLDHMYKWNQYGNRELFERSKQKVIDDFLQEIANSLVVSYSKMLILDACARPEGYDLPVFYNNWALFIKATYDVSKINLSSTIQNVLSRIPSTSSLASAELESILNKPNDPVVSLRPSPVFASFVSPIPGGPTLPVAGQSGTVSPVAGRGTYTAPHAPTHAPTHTTAHTTSRANPLARTRRLPDFRDATPGLGSDFSDG